jgi:beta-mannanase
MPYDRRGMKRLAFVVIVLCASACVVPVYAERPAPIPPGRFASAISSPTASPTATAIATARPAEAMPTVAAPPPVPVSRPVTRASVEFGAYVSGAPWDPAKLDTYAALVGGRPSLIEWYQDWAHPGVREFDPVKMDAVANRGALPVVTWNPWDDSAGASQPAYTLRTISAGAYDSYIRQWAHDAAAWGRPFSLRFAPEMNGDWFPWGMGVGGNTSADYVAAWRHVVDIFRQGGATNVSWVWCPNIADAPQVTFASLYPGDSYVDWVGLDGYNWGASQPNDPYKHWTAFSDLFGASYAALMSLTAKPMIIAETASTELGGDKAQWITQGLLTDLPARFPNVRAVIWFDENKETDWRVNSSATALTAFRTVVVSAPFRAQAPSPIPIGRPAG